MRQSEITKKVRLSREENVSQDWALWGSLIIRGQGERQGDLKRTRTSKGAWEGIASFELGGKPEVK